MCVSSNTPYCVYSNLLIRWDVMKHLTAVSVSKRRQAKNNLRSDAAMKDERSWAILLDRQREELARANPDRRIGRAVARNHFLVLEKSDD